MSAELSEIVVLVLKHVVYRHLEFRSLEEFLVERYGFSKIEEKRCEVSELKKVIPIRREEPVFEEDVEKRFDSFEIYEGIFLGSKIRVCVMGDIVQDEDVIVGADEEDQYPVYTTEYQMIKLVGESGYSIQQLIERLTIDLGLSIKSKEWIFHRSREG